MKVKKSQKIEIETAPDGFGVYVVCKNCNLIMKLTDFKVDTFGALHQKFQCPKCKMKIYVRSE